MSRDRQIKKRVNARKKTISDRSSAKRSTRATADRAGGMIPLMRCSVDAQACPAAGSIVAIFSSDERHDCIVCGRSVRVRAKYYPGKGQYLGRVPTHRHAQEDAERGRREKEARLRCRLERAESTARDALSRRAIQKATRSAQRARAIAERLPVQRSVQQRLDRLEARVLAGRAKAQLARNAMPKDAKKILRAIIDASGFDVTAVEPDGWIDHISSVLPERNVVPIAKQPSTNWIRLGLEALIRHSKPKTWDDLERRGFAGDRSLMGFVREFPGLFLLRIPDRAYEDSVTAHLLASDHYGDVPF